MEGISIRKVNSDNKKRNFNDTLWSSEQSDIVSTQLKKKLAERVAPDKKKRGTKWWVYIKFICARFHCFVLWTRESVHTSSHVSKYIKLSSVPVNIRRLYKMGKSGISLEKANNP